MKKANSKISTFDDETVPKEHFEQLIEEARSLADASRYNEGIKKIEEALEFGDKLEEISERVGKLEENIQVRRKKGMNYEPFEKKLEEVKEKVRKGKVDKALSIVDETIRKIKRRKKEERTDIKKRINETVQDLNEILEIAKKFEMDLGDIRSIISKSLDLSREGRVEKALEVLEKARDKSSRILSEEIHNTISELKEKKDSIFDDKKRKELEKYLEDASKAIKRDRFQKTYELITKCKKITKKSGLKVGNMSLTEIINIKNLSEDIGLECGDIDEMITEAKEEHKRGNTRRAKNKLRKAKEELMRRVPQGIQNVMKEGMNELEEAKKRDEDISKPVSHLKQSNLMIKKKNFVEALEYINKFTNTLEKIKEKDGSPSATVSRVKKKTRHEVKKKETTKPSREVRTRSVSQSHQKERDWTNGKASTPSSKDKEKSVEFDVDEFYEGSTNLLEVKDLSKAYDLFKKLLEKSQVGVCVTREYPEKAKKKYDLEEFLKNQNTKGSSMHSDDEDIDFSMIWLSNVDSKETVQPKDLEKLSLKLESFITRGMGIILFNGFEYLVSNNNFKTVIHLIQSLKDQVAMGGSILLITVSPDAFNKTQLDQLEREVDEVFP